MEFTQGTKASAAHFSLALDNTVGLTTGLWENGDCAQNRKGLVAGGTPGVGAE